MLAYLLAVDLCQAESQSEEESLVALTGLWKYNKQQAIPCSLCIGILQKKLKAFIESFRLSATMDMCKAYCQMLCPFVQKQDDKNNEFFVAEPRMCVVAKIWPAKKVASLVANYAVEPVITMIGKRSEFQPVLTYLESLLITIDALPEDEELADEMFEVLCNCRRVISALDSLLRTNIHQATDFTGLDALGSINLNEPASMNGKIAAAIAENETLSAKLSGMMKCMKSLKTHGPTLKASMIDMAKLGVNSAGTELAVIKLALDNFEKYNVFVPMDSLTDYKKLAAEKLLTIHENLMKASGSDLDSLHTLQALLATAQRIMCMNDQFDEPLDRVRQKIMSAASMKQSDALGTALKAYEQSEYDVAALAALDVAILALPPFELEEAAATEVTEALDSMWVSIGYCDRGQEMGKAVQKVMKSLSSRLGKAQRQMWDHRGKALQALCTLYAELHKASEQEGKEITIETKPSVNALLTSLGRAESLVEEAKKKIVKCVADEDTTDLDAAAAKAKEVSLRLAASLLEFVKAAAGPAIIALKELASGANAEDDWEKVVPADTWEQMREIGTKHLLPLDISALDAQLKLVVQFQQEFTSMKGKHSADAGWPGLEEIIKKARKTSACARLMKLFCGDGKKEAEIRRLAKAELALLKRFGILGKDLHVGMQLRVTAALKGHPM